MLEDEAVDELVQRFGAVIAGLARKHFAELIAALESGIDAAVAVRAAQGAFTGAFAGQFAEAFSFLLQRSIGPAEVRDLEIGGLTLSARLYRHNRSTEAEVLRLIRNHLQGLTDARALAMRLYDGYNPGDGIVRPLEGKARGELPKALRLITSDTKLRSGLADVIEAGQQQAARLKSKALRAAYSEAYTAWEDGAGKDALRRKLDVAQREKNRYFADRIAQTEISRAHQAQAAAELMADNELSVVQVKMNPNHPVTDICDMHARADLWGLGPGIYPKAKAPVPPYHPFCWCRLRPRPSLTALLAQERQGAAAEYLRSLSAHEAGLVMGSRERAEAVLAGAHHLAVVDSTKAPAYRTRHVGGNIGHPLLKGP